MSFLEEIDRRKILRVATVTAAMCLAVSVGAHEIDDLAGKVDVIMEEFARSDAPGAAVA